MVAGACNPSYLVGLRQENCLNSEGGGCSEPRLCHSRPGNSMRLCLKKKKKGKEKECISSIQDKAAVMDKPGDLVGGHPRKVL